jgi:hypothetical protein
VGKPDHAVSTRVSRVPVVEWLFGPAILLVAFFLVGFTFASDPDAHTMRPVARTATAACGNLPSGTTTWTAAGSPFQICAGGITVPTGSTLVISGASGPVAVQAVGFGGIAVSGGVMNTTSTTATNKVTFTGPTATPGSWAGLGFSSGGSGSLANASISNAYTGVSSSGGPTASLTLNNVSIDHSSGDAVNTSGTPLSVTGGTISDSGTHGIYAYLGGIALSSTPSLTVTGVQILRSGNEAIRAFSLSQQKLVVTNNVIDDTQGTGFTGTGYHGIYLSGFDKDSLLTMQGNRVTGTGGGPSATVPFAAIYLSGLVTGDIEPNGVITAGATSGNQGANNGWDVLAIDGTLTHNLNWKNPTNTKVLHDLGYMIGYGLTLNGAQTMTVHAGDIVKIASSGIQFNGARLDGSDSTSSAPKVFTTVEDNSVGLTTCPSAFLGSCRTPIPTYDWNGLSFATDPNNSANKGNGNLVNGVITYATTPTSISSGATQTVGSTTLGLKLTNPNFGPSYYDGISVTSTPFAVTGGTIHDAGSHGIYASMGSIAAATTSMSVTGVHILRSTNESIRAYSLGNQTVIITNNVIDNTVDAAPTYSGAGYAGISLQYPDKDSVLTVQGNQLIGTGGGPNAAIPFPAMWMVGLVTGDIEPNGVTTAGATSGNQGDNNSWDVLAMDGTLTHSLAWKNPTNSGVLHDLGYMIGSSGLTLSGAQTMTVHAGDVVKLAGGGIQFNGATLDGSDSASAAKVFTTVEDNSVGLVSCPSAFFSSCRTPIPTNDWTGLTFATDPNNAANKGNGNLVNGVITYASTPISLTSGATQTVGSTTLGLKVTNPNIGPSWSYGMYAASTPFAVNGGTIHDAGNQGIYATMGSIAAATPPTTSITVSGVHILRSGYEAIRAYSLANQTVVITNNVIDDTQASGYTGAGYAGIFLQYPDGKTVLTVQGNQLIGTGGGPGAAVPNPAIWMVGLVAGDLEPSGVTTAGATSGNQGANNSWDVLAVDGTLTHNLAWKTPSNSAVLHDLGYMIGTSGLTLSGAQTMTVHAGDVVKLAGGQLLFNGATLDGTDSTSTAAKVFTTTQDNTAGIKTCPSVFTNPCYTPIARNAWGGLSFAVDPNNSANKGNGSLTNGVIRYGSTGISISSGATQTVGSLAPTLRSVSQSRRPASPTAPRATIASTVGLFLSNTNIGPSYWDGLYDTSTPFYVSGGTISDSGGHGITAGSLSGIASSSPSMTVSGTHILRSGYESIRGTSLQGQKVVVTSNVIDDTLGYGYSGAGYSGILLQYFDTNSLLTLQQNQLTGTGGGPRVAVSAPAIEVTGLAAGDLEANGVTTAGATSGNQGARNSEDVLAVDGIISHNLVWKSPQQGTTMHDLGYLFSGGVSFNGPISLTINSGDVVKVANGGIAINGGSLIANVGTITSANKTITSVQDSTVGIRTCPSVFANPCSSPISPYAWSGISFGVDPASSANKGSGAFVNSVIRYATTGISINSGSTSGINYYHGTIQFAGSAGINDSGSPLTVTATVFSNIGGDGIDVSGASSAGIGGSVFRNISGNGVYLGNGSATIKQDIFGNVGGTSTSTYAIRSFGAAAVTCTSIHGNTQGIYAGASGNAIAYSNLYGNIGTNRYDLTVSAPTNAEHNWWGQTGGPTASQLLIQSGGSVDSLNPFAAQAPTATLAATDTNTNSNGHFGAGTVSVSVKFNWLMNTTVSPTVTISPGAHLVSGAWQPDGQTWVGNYALNSGSVTAGLNTVNVSGAASCILDPTTSNTMVPASTSFTADFSSPTAVTNPPSANTATAGTLNGTVNPNGWSGTTGFFQWGTSTGSLTSSTAAQAVANGTTAMPISASLTTLSPSTTYFYQAVGQNANTSSTGCEQTLTTPAASTPSGYFALTRPICRPTAGTPFNFTVTAYTSTGSVNTGYTGTIHFTSSDPSAVLPANYTFTIGVGGDNGSHNFGATLKTAGQQSITATDTVTSSIAGTLVVIVTPGAATQLSLGPSTSTPTHGVAFTVTVTVRDGFNNTVPTYIGTVHFTSTDATAVLPANYTFTSGSGKDNGVHTFTVTLNSTGSRTVTATDTVTSSITGSTTVTVG